MDDLMRTDSELSQTDSELSQTDSTASDKLRSTISAELAQGFKGLKRVRTKPFEDSQEEAQTHAELEYRNSSHGVTLKPTINKSALDEKEVYNFPQIKNCNCIIKKTHHLRNCSSWQIYMCELIYAVCDSLEFGGFF